MKPLMNKNGFTLVEALLAAGVLGVALFAMADVTRLMRQSTTHGEASQALSGLQENIRQILTYQSTCDAALSTNAVSDGVLLSGQQDISLQIPGLRAGTNLSSNTLNSGQVILLSKLKINRLWLTDVRPIGTNTYIAQVSLSASNLNGSALRTAPVATVQFVTNGTAITNCLAMNSDISQKICEDMACTWSSGTGCQCRTAQAPCAAGQYLTAFTDGNPTCVAISGSCGAGSYMSGLNLSGPICTPLAGGPATTTPATAPPPPPTTPPGLVDCRCIVFEAPSGPTDTFSDINADEGMISAADCQAMEGRVYPCNVTLPTGGQYSDPGYPNCAWRTEQCTGYQ